MNKQLSFIHEGKRYMTLFGADEYLSTALPKNSNVVECSVIQASGGYNASFKKTFGMEVRNVPIIQDPNIEKNGAIYVVTGSAIVDGVRSKVKITAIGVEIENDQSKKPEKEEQKPEDTVVSKQPEKEEQKPEATAISKQPEQEEPKLEVKESKVVNEVAENFMNKPVDNTTETKHKEVTVTESIEVKPKLIKDDFMNKPVKDDVIKKAGIHFGTPNASNVEGLTPGLVIGGESNNTEGFVLSGVMYSKNKSFAARTFSDRLYKRNNKSVAVNKPSTVAAKDTEKQEEKRLVIGKKIPLQDNSIISEEVPVKDKAISNSEPIAETTVKENMEEYGVRSEAVKTDTVDNKALKEKLRSEFSPEVNEVIGKIPLEILGALAEFTMNPIDTETLNRNGELYCIDNRWHKCGKWYCIDVVNNASRYFFNSKINVNIEIPIKNCKDWLNAISKQEAI